MMNLSSKSWTISEGLSWEGLAILIREMKRTDAVVACPLNGNRVGRTDITGLGECVNLR